MGRIFVTSDTHFCHSRAFIYEPRGFESIDEMNEVIVEKWNFFVMPEDIVYHLGDVMLGGPTNLAGLEYIKQLNGEIRIIRGNHDTDQRVGLYRNECPNVESVEAAAYLRYKKYHFYLSHFPTLTGNLEKESLSQVTVNLHGHTHSKNKFYNDIPYMYNVAMDAHNCYPVLLDDIIEDCKNKYQECIDQL